MGLQPLYQTLYLGFGIGTLVLIGIAAMLFRRFEGDVPQHKGIVLRRRYWLYYALTFLSGARRQLFMAFGGWLLVERFGYDLAAFSALLFIFCSISLVAGPLFGRLIGRIERARDDHPRERVAHRRLPRLCIHAKRDRGRYAVRDRRGLLHAHDRAAHVLQKISDPADIAPTASVAFTINHIAAVAIPILFGRLWIQDPTLVFTIGALIATASLGLAFLVPRDPEPGQETVFGAPGESSLPDSAPDRIRKAAPRRCGSGTRPAASSLPWQGVDHEPVEFRLHANLARQARIRWTSKAKSSMSSSMG